MEFFVARAIQIATMEINHIERIHKLEETLGYPIPNYNIQELLGLPTCKDYFSVPDDLEIQGRYRSRIESQIRFHKLEKTESGEFPNGSNLETVHQFDWNIFNGKEKVGFYYSNKKSVDSILDRVK